MTAILDIEKAASHLRRHLQLAQLPELRLLCGLRFFSLLTEERGTMVESYTREFLPILAEAARKSSPVEFLPDEMESLSRLTGVIKQLNNAAFADDLADLEGLCDSIEKAAIHPPAPIISDRHQVAVTCLLVEYYPDLSLGPRGRLLHLYVTASHASSEAEMDDIVVRNPVEEPDDRFLVQARESVQAAREYLARRYGLPLKKHYRFDFAINSTGARFTGDSLGVAFAVGAIAAVGKIEVFREQLTLSLAAAFTGAVTSDGALGPIDAEALKLKIFRAFHSGVSYLVIPRSHINGAWTYLSELEAQWPDRRLELVGADTLESVATDPRLVKIAPLWRPVYITRKLIKAKRPAWVEIPIFVILSALFLYLVLPVRYMPWFDDNPLYAISNPNTNSLEAYNRDSTLLWADMLSCPISKVTSDLIWSTSFGQAYDFNGDGHSEVVFLPRIDEICDDRANLRFYSHDGRLLWERNAAILGKYPKDTAGVQYDAGYLRIMETSNGPVILSIVYQELPARSHIRFWSAAGDSLGWYIHWGHGAIQKIVDMNYDGQNEILFTGINNRNHCTALLVLKSDSIQGFSPVESGMESKYAWWVPGNQAAYILFPKSDVGCLPEELPAGYNYPGPLGIRLVDDGQIQVYITESVNHESSPQLIYTIDHRLRVIKVVMNDCLLTHRQQLVTEGKLQPIEDAGAYFGSLRDTVTYWTDSGWVTEGQLRAAEGRE